MRDHGALLEDDFDYLFGDSDGVDWWEDFDRSEPVRDEVRHAPAAAPVGNWGAVPPAATALARPSAWYRTKAALIAFGAAVIAVPTMLLSLGSWGSDSESPTRVPPTAESPSSTSAPTKDITNPVPVVPPPPPPPPSPTPQAPAPSAGNQTPRWNPGPTRDPQVRRSPVTRAPISVSPAPRTDPGNLSGNPNGSSSGRRGGPR